jgi:hypothetical protein
MKDSLKARLYTLLPLFISILVILASVGLFYYIKGYRFDFEKQEISTTGVLTIDTIPSRSTMYIDDEEYGKTPKSITLPGGEYTLKIEKTNYHSWQKEISITEGKSSSIYPWLILEDISRTEIFSSEKTIDAEHIYQNDNSIFFILYSEDENTRSCELWRLYTNSSAWNFSENPSLVLTFTLEITDTNTFTVLPSPDSSSLLFSTSIEGVNNRYLIETNKENNLDDLSPITLNGFTDYSATWSNSNKYLLLESDTDILVYDISTGIKYLIAKKSADTFYNFTTDEDGLVYLMSGEEEDNLYTYTLSQYLYNGQFQKEVISDIYFYTTETYLKDYKDTEEIYSLPFKNSQESTKTSGKILSFSVEEDENGMFITTEYAGYWYDLETSKFILISPYSTKLSGISPLSSQLIYKNSNEVGLLTFEVEDGVPDLYVGKISRWSIKGEDITNINWLNTGKNVIYNLDDKTYICDSDGQNIVEIYDYSTTFISSQQDSSKVLVSSVNEEGVFKIYELDIH